MVKREFEEMATSMNRDITKNGDSVVVPVELIR